MGDHGGYYSVAGRSLDGTSEHVLEVLAPLLVSRLAPINPSYHYIPKKKYANQRSKLTM